MLIQTKIAFFRNWAIRGNLDKTSKFAGVPNRRWQSLVIACFFVYNISCMWPAEPSRGAERPNIVLILADDFGYECLPCNGGQSYKTPHLDRLAKQGVRFENCHVQPLCTPTRVQLMTGRYNIRNYINFGTLLRSEKTFAHLLKDAGYTTAVCGKWQLGREVDSPQHFGFEQSYLWQHTRRPPRYINPGLEKNGVELNFKMGEYGPDLMQNFACEFIEKNRGRSFFLYYPMTLTHDPFQPTPDSEDWDPTIENESQKRSPKHFAEMTTYMDKLVGALVDRLDQLGLRENTLIVFIGDNGTNRNLKSQFQGAEYPGGKGTTTMRGTHVPLIVSWPKRMKSGAVVRDLICSTDVLPTLCAAAQARTPADLDGTSFLPQVCGEKGTTREWLYSWYSPRQQNDLTVRECVFDQQYKLYRTGEYYDLRSDPDERNPIAMPTAGVALSTKTKFEAVLAQFANARPKELDIAFRKANSAKD